MKNKLKIKCRICFRHIPYNGKNPRCSSCIDFQGSHCSYVYKTVNGITERIWLYPIGDSYYDIEYIRNDKIINIYYYYNSKNISSDYFCNFQNISEDFTLEWLKKKFLNLKGFL